MGDGQRFRVLFQGKVRGAVERETLEAGMRQVFGLDDATLARLFTGAPVVIKPDADEATARHFVEVIGGLGGVCWSEPAASPVYADRRQGRRRLTARRRTSDRPGAIQPDRRGGSGRRHEDRED